MRTIQELAREALQIQNACNPLGLTKGFAEATQDLAEILRARGEFSTDAICKHPIYRLWASKMHDLAGLGLSDQTRFGHAYIYCQGLEALPADRKTGWEEIDA